MNSESGNNKSAKKEPASLVNKILIVDDEIANLKLLAKLLEQRGYQVRPLARPQLAIDSAMAQPPASAM